MTGEFLLTILPSIVPWRTNMADPIKMQALVTSIGNLAEAQKQHTLNKVAEESTANDVFLTDLLNGLADNIDIQNYAPPIVEEGVDNLL